MALLKESTSDNNMGGVLPEGANSPLNFEQLAVGFEFAPAAYYLDSSLVSKYLKSVGADEDAAKYVPPLAIAAYAMAALAKSLALPPGSIHAAQELEFLKLVPVGTSISYRGRVAQKLSRGKLNMLVIELDALDQSGEKVLSGKATLILPG